MKSIHLLLKLALCFILFTGCASVPKTTFDGSPKSDAEAEYRAAVKTLESGSFEDAVKAFHHIKLKYPYATRWATLCDLRIADAYRYSGEYAQAATSYQAFIRTYPAHADISYASYQVANCYYEMMPSDNFILPDPWQRDRKSTTQAQVAFKTYLKQYPDDENVPVAKEQYAEVIRRLANHELYVAEYNFKNEAYQGSINRLNGLIASYPDSEVAPKAHILLAHSYLKVNDPISAKKTLNQLIKNYPDSSYSQDAKNWIAANPNVP